MPSVQIGDHNEEYWRALNRRPLLTFVDAERIKRDLDVPAIVAVSSSSGGRIDGPNGAAVENVWIEGVDVNFLKVRQYGVAKGRMFSAPEDRLGSNVVVLGYETADKLFGPLDPLGRRVKITSRGGIAILTVVGVLEKQGSLFGQSMDNRAMAPAHSAIAPLVNPHGNVDEILIRGESPEAIPALKVSAEASMRTAHHLRPTQKNDFEVETADDSLSFWDKISRILYMAFPGLVGIALVVGGMVIMNIMLISVAERTREIGVRKALGATRGDVRWQFLTEAMTVTGVGGIIGVLVGALVAWLVNALSPFPAAIQPFWVVLAFVTSVVVGLVFGLWPAAKAARLDPVEALRYE
jgi:putative ABC transport system permease protein